MTDLLSRIRSLVAGVREIGAEYKAIGQALADAQSKRAELERLPRPRECLLRALNSYVDSKRDAFDKHARAIVDEIQRDPCGAVEGHRAPGYNFLDPLIRGEALNHLLATTLKNELARVVNTMHFENVGPPIASRAAERDRLDRQIADLKKQLAEIQAEADRAGVLLEA
jgi:hypothetical protein